MTPVQIAAGALLDLGGVNQTVASLSDLSGSGGTVTNSSAGPATLTLTPTRGSTTFSGVIQNEARHGCPGHQRHGHPGP